MWFADYSFSSHLELVRVPLLSVFLKGIFAFIFSKKGSLVFSFLLLSFLRYFQKSIIYDTNRAAGEVIATANIFLLAIFVEKAFGKDWQIVEATIFALSCCQIRK